MIDKLTEYLNFLDTSNVNHTDFYIIDKEIQKIRDELAENNNISRANVAQLEMEVINFNKFVEKGLRFKISGTQKNNEGIETPFEWPDVNNLTDDKFTYIKSRFDNTKNLFLKSEYGLILLLAPASRYKDNKIALEVIRALLKLSTVYQKKTFTVEDKDDKHWYIFLTNVLKNSFELSKLRKNDSEIATELKMVENTILDFLKKIPVEHSKALRIYADLTRLIMENHKEFAANHLHQVLNKIWKLAKHTSISYLYGGIDLAQLGLMFEKKTKLQTDINWLKLIAENYEILAKNAENKKESTAVKFYEDALKTYKQLKDKNGVKRIERKFLEIKNKAYGIGTYRTPIPASESKRIYDQILKVVADSSEIEILYFIMASPMIMKLDRLKEISEEISKKTVLLNNMPVSVSDKRGFTVKTYKTLEEIKEFNRLKNFEIDFQFAVSNLFWFYVEAVKANKLTYKSIKNFLETRSWMGKKYDREYQGKVSVIRPLDLILPSVKFIFSEINKSIKSNTYKMNLVLPIDSLTLKMEFLLRFFCEILGIPTYKDVDMDKGIKQEKDINILLNEEALKKNILEDDIFLLKFVLVERMGYNLRNNVAHGLYDRLDEYDAYKAILLITLLLKISSYEFIKKEIKL